jgi:hypothetical protein
MSSLYVRNKIRQWAALCATPFYDTINLEQNPSDPVWFTVSFEVENSETLTFCKDELEEGVIDLVFSGSAGAGDAAVLTAAEADAKVFLAQADAGGKLVLKRAMPPEEFSAGTASDRYLAVVGLIYSYTP